MGNLSKQNIYAQGRTNTIELLIESKNRVRKSGKIEGIKPKTRRLSISYIILHIIES